MLAFHGWGQKFEFSIYIDANIIGKRDISMLDTVYSIGQKNATIYDRRLPVYVDATRKIIKCNGRMEAA
ncbi:MAG: hypothetical protein P1U56_22230 [Saprospiraceae bacterium]|nr:hypothetical protein [Saprospiraceae bacterium]